MLQTLHGKIQLLSFFVLYFFVIRLNTEIDGHWTKTMGFRNEIRNETKLMGKMEYLLKRVPKNLKFVYFSIPWLNFGTVNSFSN